MPIPLYLNQNLSSVLCPPGSPGACSHFGEIQVAVESALHQFFEAPGANLRLEVRTDASVTPGTVIASSVHVYGKSDCANGPLEVTWGDLTGDGRPDWGRLAFCTTYQGQAARWLSLPASSSPGTGFSFEGFLTGGLLEVLGFRPPATCGQTAKSAVAVNAFNSHEAQHLYRDDIAGLQAAFGLRPKQVPFLDLTDAPLDGNPLPADGNPLPALQGLLGRISVASGLTPVHTFLSAPRSQAPRSVQVFAHSAGLWPSYLADLGRHDVARQTHTFTGTAAQDDRRALVAWQGAYDDADGLMSIYTEKTEDAFASETATELVVAGSERTRSPGVSAAFDPASQRYVLLWRDSSGAMVTQVLAPGAVPRRYLTKVVGGPSTPRRAADVPSLSCAPAWVGSENCVMTWLGASWGRPMLWARARVESGASGPTLVLGPSQAGPGFASASPSVTNWWPVGASDVVWQLAYLQGDVAPWVCRREQAASAWDCGLVPFWTQSLTTPTLGSYATCNGPVGCGSSWNPGHSIVLGVAAHSAAP